jgi:hypothetical protein
MCACELGVRVRSLSPDLKEQLASSAAKQYRHAQPHCAANNRSAPSLSKFQIFENEIGILGKISRSKIGSEFSSKLNTCALMAGSMSLRTTTR